MSVLYGVGRREVTREREALRMQEHPLGMTRTALALRERDAEGRADLWRAA